MKLFILLTICLFVHIVSGSHWISHNTRNDVDNVEKRQVDGYTDDDDDPLELQDNEESQDSPMEEYDDTKPESTKERTKKSNATDKDVALKAKEQKIVKSNETVQKPENNIKAHKKKPQNKKENQTTKKATKLIQNLLIERVKHLHKIKKLENNIQKSKKAFESLKHKYEIKKIKDSVKNGSLLKNLKKGDLKDIVTKSKEIPIPKNQKNSKSKDRKERIKDKALIRKWLRRRPNKLVEKCKNGKCSPGTISKVGAPVKGEGGFNKTIRERSKKLNKLTGNKSKQNKSKQSHNIEELRKQILSGEMRNQARTHAVLQEKITKKALIKLKKAIQRVLFMIAKKERRLKTGKTKEKLPDKLRKMKDKNGKNTKEKPIK